MQFFINFFLFFTMQFLLMFEKNVKHCANDASNDGHRPPLAHSGTVMSGLWGGMQRPTYQSEWGLFNKRQFHISIYQISGMTSFVYHCALAQFTCFEICLLLSVNIQLAYFLER